MEAMNRSLEQATISGYIKEMRSVRIILRNGFQIRGVINKQDDVVIAVFDDENRPEKSLIYKEDISTIVPI